MTERTATTILLGPQRRSPNVREALARIPSWSHDQPTAVVTAGWEDRELDDLPFQQHIEGPVRNLEVFGRLERVYAHDRELHAAVRRRHDRMRELNRLYRVRLGHALDAARQLLAESPVGGGGTHSEELEAELSDSIETVRRLDAFHSARLATVEAEFQESICPQERDSIGEHRREIEAILRECQVLCIAGGHVGILLSRMRLLGVLELHGDRPLVGWSAGAMALTERVVLFHDSPPQGPGDAEVYETGLGVARGVVALPDADQRLRLEDPGRVALFARRFAPALCAALLPEARFESQGGAGWVGSAGARRLDADGVVREGAA